jgi:hypothetical protein
VRDACARGVACSLLKINTLRGNKDTPVNGEQRLESHVSHGSHDCIDYNFEYEKFCICVPIRTVTLAY